MKRLRRVRPSLRSRGSRTLSLAALGKSVRRNKMPLLGAGLLVGGLVFLTLSVHSFIFASEYFFVRDIEVVNKNPQKIDHSLARLRRPANLFTLDLEAIQRRLEESYPEIQTVRVSRVLPNKLVLEVIHRRPVAQIAVIARAGETPQYYTVNEEGYILARHDREPRRNLPIITGVAMRPQDIEIGRCYERSPIEAALTLRRQLLAREIWQKHRVTRIDVAHPRSIMFVLDDRVEVRLAAADAEARLDQLAGILESEALDRSRSSYVDLRFKDVVIGSHPTQ